jgi:hypothetical protein
MELPTGLLRAPEQDHPIASPWPCRFGWRWIVSILERIRDQEPATARLVSLNRARRGAYNDIDSVNISGGLWLAGMSVSTARSLTCLLCLGNPLYFHQATNFLDRVSLANLRTVGDV